MSGSSVLLLALGVALACMTGWRAYKGLRDGQMVWFGMYRDSNPVDRNDHPRLFWASITWAIFLFAISVCGVVSILIISLA